MDVAAVQPAGDAERRRRRQQRQCEDRRGVSGRRQEQREEHEPAADRVPEAVEADVDERLRRAFLGRRDGRVEELVARAEERSAEHRFAAPRDDRTAEAGREEAGEAAEKERERRRGRRDGEAQFFENQTARGRLKDERNQTCRRVVAREEAHQQIAPAEGADDFELEHVVEERRAERAEEDERRKAAEIRRFGEHPQSGARRRRGQLWRDVHGGRVRRSVERTAQGADLPGADQVERREDRQHRGDTGDGGHTFREQAAQQAADRAAAGDLSEALLRRARIKALGGDEPEARAEDRAEPGDQQVDGDRGASGRGDRQSPGSEEQQAARQEGERDEGAGREPSQRARADADKDDGEGGGEGHHRWQRGDIELGQVQGVACSLAGDELRGDGGRGERGSGDRRAQL